ncbi:RHS repeat-associated core domain-containing protein [Sphingobacterium haloxyli]|nr:RHS repeat-associated core domain-containing protein [Sphingobacterium haloxyli]
MTQDALQRTKNPKEWSYTKYDAFGRVVQTGTLTAAHATQLAAQTAADNHATASNRHWESRGVNASQYSNVSFPKDNLTRLTVNYYDNYNKFMGSVDTVQLAPRAISRSTKVHSLLTGSRVYTDSGTDSLLTVYYYDERGRIIQTASRNLLGGKDIVTNTYLFSGEVETSKHEHWASLTTQPATTILTANKYDHVGRLVETKKKVNSQPEVIQSRLSYNEIGQLTEKKLHSESGGTSFLTTVGYAYNERGWQSRAGSPQFTYQLNYHKNGNTVLSNAQYNGNIAQQQWGHGPTTNSTFTYSYDRLNRLTNGTSSGGTVMIEALTYDDMGNIRTLRRDNGTVITYSYNNSQKSNRLAGLSGGLSGSFTYDLNGNATKDRTGMNFAYNHLNLPRRVSKAAVGTAPAVTVSYLYDAAGKKLRRTATVGTTTTQQDYIGGIEYRKTGTAASVIERISTEEGYLQNSGGTYAYHYHLTDHLGNVRTVLKRGTGATTVEVVQRQDYYPFGKTKAIVTGGINRYLYNGKEMQADLNGGTHALGSSYVLEGQLDYGARFYDAEIGRWNVVDRFAEKYSSLSPYQYGELNPIVNVDINGDSTWTTTTTSEVGGRVTNTYTTHIRGKVLNMANDKNLTGLANSISKRLSGESSSKTFSDGSNNVYKIDAEYTFVNSMDQVDASDHLLVVVNEVLGEADSRLGGGPAGGIAQIGGKVAYVESGSFLNMKETAFHEIGHNLGLRHPEKNSAENNPTNPMAYKRNNAPHFSRHQLSNIFSYSKSGFSNRGKNSAIIINNRQRTNTRSTNESPYRGIRTRGLKIPYPKPNIP